MARADECGLGVVLDQIHDAVVATDLAGYVTLWNRSARDLWGYERDEAIGQRLGTLLLASEERHKLDDEILPHVLEHGSGEWIMRTCRKDGTEVVAHGRGVLLRSQAGQPSAILGFVRDVTPLERASPQRDRTLAELAQLQRVASMNELAARLTHEVGQPLNAVTNYASVLEMTLASDAPDLEDARARVEELTQAAQRAARVLRSVRSFVGQRSATRELVDLGALLREGVSLLAPELERRSIRVRLRVAEGLPEIWVVPHQIHQVLLQLIQNASEALELATGEVGEILVWARLEGACRVAVSVIDRGIGLPPESEAWMFDAFHSTRRGRMGLGLCISRSLIESHRGAMRLEQAESGETVATFWLPVVQPPLNAGTRLDV